MDMSLNKMEMKKKKWRLQTWILIIGIVIALIIGGIIMYKPKMIQSLFDINQQKINPINKHVTLTNLSTDDIFKNLIYNQGGITQGEAIFEIYNPVDNFALKNLTIDFSEYQGSGIGSYELYINVSENYTDIQKIIERIAQTCTLKNETPNRIIDCTFDNMTLVHVNKSRESWKAIGDGVKINQGYYKIRLIAHWKAQLGLQSIDWIPSVKIGKEFTGLSGDTILTKHNWAWWNTTYIYAQNITINESVDLQLGTFPFILNFTTYNITYFGDFAVVYNESTRLPCEVVNWTNSNAEVWCGNATIELDDIPHNNFTIYYNKTGNPISYNPLQVWRANYTGTSDFVWHLNSNNTETCNGNACQVEDSNGNRNGTLKTNTNKFNLQTNNCVYGRCLNMTNANGASNSINKTESVSNSVYTSATVSFWYYNYDNPCLAGPPDLAGRGTTGDTTKWYIYVTAAAYGMNVDDTVNTTTTNSSCNTWNYVAMRWNTTRTDLFVNATKIGTLAKAGPSTGGIGGDFFGYGYQTGAQVNNLSIDEIRFIGRYMSDQEINQTYQQGVKNWAKFNHTEMSFNIPPTTPTNIECNGNSQCNISVDNSVILNASGSTDSNNDTINYTIEATLMNVSQVINNSDYSYNISGTFTNSVFNQVEFEDCASITEWNFTGPSNWAVNATNWCRVTPTSSANMTSPQFDLTGYSFANFSFDYNYALLDSGEGMKFYINSSTNSYVKVYNDISGGANSNVGTTTKVLGIDANITLGANITLRIECIASSGTTEACGVDNINLTGWNNPTTANEKNTTNIFYNMTDANQTAFDNITIKVEVSSYRPNASAMNGNLRPDLFLAVWNGTTYLNISNFGLGAGGGYANNNTNTSVINFSITTSNSAVLNAWGKNTTNQSFLIYGINMDVNNTVVDIINYTNIYMIYTGKTWQFIGNHSASTTFSWNTASLSPQNGINLRAKAIDELGSNIYSAYFYKGSFLNISHGQDNEYPLFYNFTDNNGSQTGTGQGNFSVSVNLTNGTVIIDFNNVNYSASNSSDIRNFNRSISSISAGTYSYYWGSWGNGTSKNYNISALRYYTINGSANSCTYTTGNWLVSCDDNCTITSDVNLGGNNIIINGTGYFILNGANVTNYNTLHRFSRGAGMCEVGRKNGGGFRTR